MQNDDFIEIASAAARCFGDDGTLDAAELNSLLGLAMRDGGVSEKEKQELAKLFERALQCDLDPKVRARIGFAKRQHNIE